jgi:calcineurin-like phosphoesterase
VIDENQTTLLATEIAASIEKQVQYPGQIKVTVIRETRQIAMGKIMRIIFFGDVYGKAGREALLSSLPGLKDEFRPDFILANAENLADGKGLTEKTLYPLLQAGVHAVTGGNHLWDRAESLSYIANQNKIIKPRNYPEITLESLWSFGKRGTKLGIISLCGQIYMPPCDNPFTSLQNFWDHQKDKEDIPIILDIHAESTSEKELWAGLPMEKLAAVLGNTYSLSNRR